MVRIPSQDNTDFDKAVDFLLELQKREPTKYKVNAACNMTKLALSFYNAVFNNRCLQHTLGQV